MNRAARVFPRQVFVGTVEQEFTLEPGDILIDPYDNFKFTYEGKPKLMKVGDIIQIAPRDKDGNV